jgi:hypothetical protein
VRWAKESELMKMNVAPLLALVTRPDSKKWIICGTALVSFLAGSLVTTHITQANEPSTDNNRVFELLVYHTIPGKVPALESIFRAVSKLEDKYGLKVVGYWVPNESVWPNTFIYLVVHPNRQQAKQNWIALHADPTFPKYRKQAAEILEKVNEDYRVDEVYMRPTDYSAMK